MSQNFDRENKCPRRWTNQKFKTEGNINPKNVTEWVFTLGGQGHCGPGGGVPKHRN